MKFILLLFALSVPFWLLGAATRLELLPGLPVAALMAFCPGTAAAILVFRQGGVAGLRGFLLRPFDFRRIERKIWYFPVLGFMPAVMLGSYWLMRWTGTPLQPPEIAFLPTALLFLIFFVTAVGEELGWSGYATEPMQSRWGAVQAGVVLGLIWAAWHVVALLQADRTPIWIAGWSLGTVANRVIMVWLYNRTNRSVFAMALYHATQNLTWQLFPDHGSHYDPWVTGPVLVVSAVLITQTRIFKDRRRRHQGREVKASPSVMRPSRGVMHYLRLILACPPIYHGDTYARSSPVRRPDSLGRHGTCSSHLTRSNRCPPGLGHAQGTHTELGTRARRLPPGREDGRGEG